MLSLLYDELDVLSRAVAYPNLSHAAQHIGLSQPQLSRILKKIEEELGVVLLDRSAKRKSGWTELAHQIAQAYLKTNRTLEGEVMALVEGKATPDRVRLGLLEGLMEPALELAEFVFKKTEILQVEMDVLDLGPLERHFLRGDFDLILSVREPGRQKYSHLRKLGHQSLATHHEGGQILAMSPYEMNSLGAHDRKSVRGRKILLSNSLAIRRIWITEKGAQGVLPSKLLPANDRAQNLLSVYLIASESFPGALWKNLLLFRKGE